MSGSRQPLWDWPVRIGHWLMVILVAACWWTAEQQQIVYHRYCAYALLGLVVFRIYWGFCGGSTARFAHFVRPPGVVWHYLKTLPQREAKVSAGHNPLGGYSVLLLLLLLLLQIVLGLFAIDVDGFEGGPFVDALSFKTSRVIAGWHEFTFNLLLGFIALHILAVLYYLIWRRQNLTASMLHGKTLAVTGSESISAPLQSVGPARFLLGVALAALVVWLIA